MDCCFSPNPGFHRDEVKTPGELIDRMFETTTEDGCLTLSGFPDDEGCHNYNIQAHMAWTEPDRAAAAAAFHSLMEALQAIAAQDSKPDGTADNARAELAQPLFGVWNVYLRDFDYGTPGPDTFYEISVKLDENRAEPEEEAVYRNTVKMIDEQCALRLGRSIYAYQFIIRAKRVHRLMVLNAPEIIITGEAKLMAQAMVLNRYAVSTATVDLSEAEHA